MDVPFLDLGAPHAEIRDELDEAISRVIDSQRFVLGQELECFEAEFAAYCSTRHCVGVASGLDALHLALRACDIGQGDEVIVPAHTFVATWLAVTYSGARPVPVDVAEADGNIDASLIAPAVTERTRAVIAVDLHGCPASYPELDAIGRDHGLIIVEDAAQAHGARFNGMPAGSLGHVAAFSFYPGKNLGALGDAGAVTTDDPAIADAVRRLRNYGGIHKYEHQSRGFNSRLDELQAAVLRVKLGRLESWNDRRRSIAGIYRDVLATVAVDLIDVDPRALPSWHLFPIRHDMRARLADLLQKRGVDTGVHYPQPVHRTAAYADGYAQAQFPVAEAYATRELSLPIGPHMTDDHARYVAQVVADAVAELS